MAVPSVGDILMLSQLAWRIGRAFSAGRTSVPAEFTEVETEIYNLAKALKLLAETLFADSDDSLISQADKGTQGGTAIILNSCQRTVNDLDSLTDQYQVIKKHRTADGFAIERSWSDLVLAQYKSMMWTTEGGNIQNLHSMLQIHTSTVHLIMQALQSKSLSRLESVIVPIAGKVDTIHDRAGSLNENLKETHRIVREIASRTPQLPAPSLPESAPLSSTKPEDMRQISPALEDQPAKDISPPHQSSKPTVLPSPQLQSLSPSTTAVPSSPSDTTTHRPISPTSVARKRISEFSYGGSSRYSSSCASSDTTTSSDWPSPTQDRTPHVSRQPSKKEVPFSRPDSAILPLLPPPAIDLPLRPVENSRSSLRSRGRDEIIRLHRSSTTGSQRAAFEKQAFRNAAILCDVRGSLVEYTQKTSPDDPHDVEMVEACGSCRIAVVRKREPTEDRKSVRMMTSIWVFADDNTIRMQLEMAEGDVYVPYSSYFNPEKISVTVACDLRFHGIEYGRRLEKSAKTGWINYVFEDGQAAALFQNELMGRTLLATYRTEKTMRIHEGLSGAFTYAEQMCGMENLRIWEDNDTAAVIALIHFSAHFRNGYLAFYLNSSGTPIRVKDEGGREVKIKGLRVPLEKGALRKDSAVGSAAIKEDKKKVISGARIEFASEVEKRGFLDLVKSVQRKMLELPDLLGVN